MKTGGRVSGLDVLRGAAAIAIAVYHCNAILSLAKWPPQTNYLSFAVELFFALSAFSLCIRYQGNLGDAEKIKQFYLRRFLRIAPLFYAMILAYSARRLYYGWDQPSFAELALNVTFLFPLVPGKHESLVAAGWSLGLEMMFYALFPLMVASILNLRQAAFWFGASLVVQSLVGYSLYKMQLTPNFSWMAFPVQLPFFLFGVVLFHLFRKVEGRPAKQLVTFAYAIASAVVALVWLGLATNIFETRIDSWPALRPLLGYLLAVPILAFSVYSFPLVVNRATVYLGEISYGIYLIHPLMIRLVGAPLQEAGHSAMIVILAVLAATFTMAAVSYHFLEKPFMRLQLRARGRQVSPSPAQ
jgi:peptidoglycan/LPS O-acetylase OafA/YrhL